MTSLNNTSVVSGTSEDYGVIQYQETLPLRIFRRTLFTLIILASLIGNSVVCKAIWRAPHRKPFSYHVVANMAFAEIVNSLCLPIMYVWQYDYFIDKIDRIHATLREKNSAQGNDANDVTLGNYMECNSLFFRLY